MASQPDLVEVISRIAVGDESALAELYDATSPLLFGLILRILGDRAVAEEVLLEVYWQLWHEASTYSPDRHTPLSWLVTRARRRALDRLGLSPSRQPGSKPPDSTNLAFAAEKQRLVRSALNDLREEERQVLGLAYYAGLSSHEIAQRLGRPPDTVRTQLGLAMTKLRQSLKTSLEEPE